ncbi:MAG: DUF2442 domain-containing protein [Acidobacteria bacterium]|nr:MAG: DUF2442 domain-containing protein [Acidobacteriota bacterium]
MHFVKDVQYLSEYKLRLTFEDGTMRDVDLASHLDGEVFEPLKNLMNFKSVHVNPDPDFLYEISCPVAESMPAA